MRVWAFVILSGGRRASSLRVSSSIPRNSRVDAGPAVLSWARGRLIFAARFGIGKYGDGSGLSQNIY